MFRLYIIHLFFYVYVCESGASTSEQTFSLDVFQTAVF